MFRKFLIVSAFVFPLFLLAQDRDEQLAAQYFNSNEFAKALDVYEKLFSKTPASNYIYENLLICYFNLKKYEDAEKTVKKLIRKNPDNPYYPVDLGYVYKKSGKEELAKKQFDEIVNKLKGRGELIVETANAFQKRNEFDRAVSVYQKGRKLNNNNPQLFCIELANLYAQKREIGLMVDEYLNAIQNNPGNVEEVQGYLQSYLENDAEYEILKQGLLKKNTAFPGNETFSEMLIWMFVQRKDFTNAFVSAKALDKRFKEDGRRLVELGYLAVSNEKFDAGSIIYSYIASLGKEKPFYINGRLGMLEAKNNKIFFGSSYSETDLKMLEKDYRDFLTEFGKDYFTAPAERDLARLYAYYLNDQNAATELFNELIDMPRLDEKFKAECKLELGDIMVLNGSVWDAMLLYGQVDKEFKEDPLGQDAKFRNARLSYYLGEFTWARSQLDILKTATTQLISNDALELSLLIQDNTPDSNDEALLMFARADLNFFQNKFETSILILDSINLLYPRHPLDDDILYKRAQIFLKKKNYQKACDYLRQLLNEHGSDILGDNALFLLATITEKNLNDKPGAMKLYEEFIEKYPGSFFLTEVRKRYRSLRGDQLN
ncbi:MAG: tetratricopeptide repeat protein [Bacteroidia bacterium]